MQGLNFAPRPESSAAFSATSGDGHGDEAHFSTSAASASMAPSVEVVVCKADELSDGE